ncbi:MAG: NADPH-dependent FMN reductase [Pyrinomonadaceae bacterium]
MFSSFSRNSVLLGTNRKDRQSENVAKWVFGKMQEREEDIEPQFFDVRDFDLPRDDYGTGIGKDFPEWRDAIIRADGLIIVTPEYNHSYSGVLKSVLDLLLKEYIHKAVLLSVCPPDRGAERALSNRVCRWSENSV